MPTGYTAGVADGSITTFEEYALQCARNFGALILMRDEPMNASIPEAFAPSSYHTTALTKARDELARLSSMSVDECEVAAQAAHAEAVEGWTRRRREDEAQRGRYAAMRAQAAAWKPPTLEHQGLKEFMVSQIDESMKFDSLGKQPAPELRSGWVWRDMAVLEAKRSIEYHAKEEAAEIERTNGRTAWVQALRQSLA